MKRFRILKSCENTFKIQKKIAIGIWCNQMKSIRSPTGNFLGVELCEFDTRVAAKDWVTTEVTRLNLEKSNKEKEKRKKKSWKIIK